MKNLLNTLKGFFALIGVGVALTTAIGIIAKTTQIIWSWLGVL